MARRAPIIAGAVFIVLAILGVLVLVLPKMGEVSDTKEQLTVAKRDAVQLRAELSRLEDAKAAAPEAEAEILELETQIPPTVDQPGMIRLLSDAAAHSATQFWSLAPGAPTADESGEFSVISASLTVNGDYFSLDEFLYRLEHLPRAVKVMNVTLGTAAAGAIGDLSMQLTVELYTTDPDAGPSSDPAPGESFASVTDTGA